MEIILLIDDDEDECLIFSEALNIINLPLQLACLKDAASVMQWIKSNTANFIFIDMMMPKITGIELMQQMRAALPSLTSKFILLSTYVDERLSEKATASGAVACMQKTDTVKELANLLAEFFADYQL